jgi:5'-nucleotidase
MSNYILISNDDGVDAPGLLALRQALATVDEVRVIAPETNWSAAGHTKTLHRPLRIRETHLRDGSDAYKCDGAPSDCVAVALLGFFPERPSLVVSGINPNANVGKDITYSGTVAAAMEAAIDGIPAIAVSLDRQDGVENYLPAAAFAARLARRLLRAALPADTLLNVNVPDVPAAELRGIEITRAGKRIYYDRLVRREDPFGNPYYWIGGEKPGGDKELPGTDIWALANNKISITPIHMDMTSHLLIERLRAELADLD